MNETKRKYAAEAWNTFANQEDGLFPVLDRMVKRSQERVVNSDAHEIQLREFEYAYQNACLDLREAIEGIIKTGALDALELKAEAEIKVGTRKPYH